MSDTTTIEWTTTTGPDGTVHPGYTFNPWTGCAKTSPACAHCYAEALAKRNSSVFGRWGPGTERRRTSDANWRKPLAWDRKAARLGVRLKVFCASMADVFEDRADLDQMRHDLWALIKATPHLDWLLLTKRPATMRFWMSTYGCPENVWTGVTVEDQRRADECIPALVRVPARVRFLSMEPLLGPVNILGGDTVAARALGPRPADLLHWVIVGGESGPSARVTEPGWALSIRDQCKNAGVPFFFKQWGEWVYEAHMTDDAWEDIDASEKGFSSFIRPYRLGKSRAGRLLDGETWGQMPILEAR